MSLSYLTIVEYCLLVGKFGFVSNFVLGGLLVYLTIFCIERQFGSYKKLLVTFQVTGFIFAAFHFVFPTQLHTYNRSLIYFILDSPFDLPHYILEWLIGICTGIFAATLCILAIQFLYRYWSVFDTEKLKYFNGYYYLIWILYFIVFGAGWAFSVSYCFALTPSGKQYLAGEVLVKYGKNISEIPVVSLISYEGDRIRWESVYGLVIISVITVVQYSIICVCAFKLYKGMMEKLSVMSSTNRRIHKQFYKALMIQTFAPSIFLFSPVFFMLAIPYADLEFSFPSSIFACAFTVYPVIDSICIMLCVSEYGRCFRKLTKLVRAKIGATELNSITRDSSGIKTKKTATTH